MSEIQLAKFQVEKRAGMLIARIINNASPSNWKEVRPEENASYAVRRAAEASPTKASVECNF